MRKSVLVIGGTNFVGPYILKNLLDSGREVSVCTRGIHKNPFENQVSSYIADTNNDRESVKRVLGGKSFDAVIDCVAYCPNEVINILETVETGRYIQVSSMGVYDYMDGLIKEEHYNPLEVDWDIILSNDSKNYGLRKRAAEAVAFQKFANLKPVTVRPGYVTDPNNILHDLNMRLFEIVEWIANGEKIDRQCAHWRCCFTHVEDEAKLVTMLVDSDYCSPVNVSCEGSIELSALFSCAANRLGKEVRLCEEGRISGFSGKTVLDISLCKQLFLEPINLDEWLWNMVDSIIDTISDYKQKEWGTLMKSLDCCS